jgi:hypothetical protein
VAIPCPPDAARERTKNCARDRLGETGCMPTPNRRESIERHLTESQELDHETYAHLAEAAGLLADAEARFLRLTEQGWQE